METSIEAASIEVIDNKRIFVKYSTYYFEIDLFFHTNINDNIFWVCRKNANNIYYSSAYLQLKPFIQLGTFVIAPYYIMPDLIRIELLKIDKKDIEKIQSIIEKIIKYGNIY